jgi:arylsulfatase A-like enzyme
MNVRCALLLGLALGLGSGGARAAAPAAAERPRLVVLLVVDQMRADYVDRYGARWKGGLRRLLDGGASMRSARFPYLDTYTCPGHATIGTGTYPHIHGMVLNKWYDRALGRPVECTEDPGAAAVSQGTEPGQGKDSARSLVALTLADQMKARLTPAPRVVALATKPRSAIDLGGHRPDAAVWFDGATWVSSNAFTQRPIPWVQAFLAAHPIAATERTPWTRMLGASAYLGPDDAANERPPAGWGRTFPHPLVGAGINGLERWVASPAADAYLGEMARAAVTALKLGQGPSTDFLALSFSANDYVGHAFGPRSHEVQDVLLRLDATIGRLLDALDGQVGRGRYVVALTSDHGVSEIPEQLRAEGKESGRLVGAALRGQVEAVLAGELGPGPHLADVEENDVYLRPGVPQRLAARPGAMTRVLAGLRAMPGMLDAVSSAEVSNPARAADATRKAIALGYFAGRSGDILLVRRNNWLVGQLAANHGTLHDDDQRVPLIFQGKGWFKPGRYPQPASPADAAPTLGSLIGVELPRAEGRVVSEVLVRPAAEVTHRVTTVRP